MDIGLREWLAIIGVIVILAIIADGFRRYLGRSTLKFKLDRNLIKQFSEEVDNPEIVGPVRSSGKKTQPVAEPESKVEPGLFDSLPSEEEAPQRHAPEPSISAAEPQFEAGFEQETEYEPEAENETDDSLLDPEEIFILYVEKHDEQGLPGSDLLQSVLESGMRFGDMDIFHRHENVGSGDKLFSLANALKPGVFDLDNMEDFSTRSVCFFMSLPGPRQPRQAFELMLAAARKLADELGGELKDDQRSNLTGQTTEHYRQRIQDFERRQLSLRI